MNYLGTDPQPVEDHKILMLVKLCPRWCWQPGRPGRGAGAGASQLKLGVQSKVLPTPETEQEESTVSHQQHTVRTLKSQLH